MAWTYTKPFLIALGAVAAFSLFAWMADRFHAYSWSRVFMWLGGLFLLAGCYLFGTSVFNLPLGWMLASIALFTVGFGLTAGYFLRRRRSRE